MDITRSSLFSTMLYCLILVALFWWGTTTGAQQWEIDATLRGDSWNILDQLGFREWRLSDISSKIIGALLMFVISFMVARLAIRNVIFLERTYMPSVLFVLLSSMFYNNEQSIAPLVATMFIVIASSMGMSSYMVKRMAIRKLFSSALYFGLALSVYPPSVYLAPFVFVIVSIFRISHIKEWIVAIVGLVLPIGLMFLVFWSFELDFQYRWSLFYEAMTINDGSTRMLRGWNLDIVQYLFIAIVVLLFMLSIIRFLRTRKSYKHRSVLCVGYFVIFSFWSVAVMLLSPARSLYMLPIVALPLSILIPIFFAASRPTFWNNALYITLLMLSIALLFL